MTSPIKQHLIDPEICIRCYTCEMTCPIGAITHNDDNVVVDPDICNHCMDCISPCPTGSIDEWRIVTKPYSLEEQYEWEELPEQEEVAGGVEDGSDSLEALDDAVAALLEEAHKGAGGRAKAPASAAKPTINLFNLGKPATATLTGAYRLTAETSDADIRHLILDLGDTVFPVLEGQSVGVLAPGVDAAGKPHLPRLYSVSSPRDGERPNTNNLSLTVKREDVGVCSNYLCDLEVGAEVRLTGPFGATFLSPEDPAARCVMICTGTGSAPFRGFVMRRQRTAPARKDGLDLYFGARTPDALPYFGPLEKVPDEFMRKRFAFSRVEGASKVYVQDKLREDGETLAKALTDGVSHFYICGLKSMETGVEAAFEDIAAAAGLDWRSVRDGLREEGRYHVETY